MLCLAKSRGLEQLQTEPRGILFPNFRQKIIKTPSEKGIVCAMIILCFLAKFNSTGLNLVVLRAQWERETCRCAEKKLRNVPKNGH